MTDLPAVQAFLYDEAALLDGWKLKEWLELCTDDVVYWLPIGSGSSEPDPTQQVSIAYDDRLRLEERVARLLSGAAHSQDPPSETVRVIGNIRVLPGDPGQLLVRSSFSLFESRLGRDRQYAGHLEHMLVEDGDTLRIRQKRVRLIQSESFLPNLSFIV
jgi:p-cumate 2,3-dioxygenase beta subunit